MVDKRANHDALRHYGSDEDKRLSYKQLHFEIIKLASVLNDRIPPGDRVLILLQPGIDYILSFTYWEPM